MSHILKPILYQIWETTAESTQCRESQYTEMDSSTSTACQYNMHSSTPGTMAEYYGSLGGRAWSSMPTAAMATDLERSQNTIFFSKAHKPSMPVYLCRAPTDLVIATDVPSFYPNGNMLSSEDHCANRLLPVPTTTGLSSANGSNTETYLKDIDVTANGSPFMPGEETGNMYSWGSRSSNSIRAKPISTRMPFSSTYGTSGLIAHEQKNDLLSPNQNLMMKYTAITDSPFDTIPTTSSVFARSGTADSSDLEEPLMMSMTGPKNAQGDSHTKNDKSSTYGYKLRAPLEEYVTRSDSGLYTHAETVLQSSSSIRGLALSHQNY